MNSTRMFSPVLDIPREGKEWGLCWWCTTTTKLRGKRKEEHGGTHGGRIGERLDANDTSYGENLDHPTIQNKWVLLDPFDLRIKHVSSQTDAFQRDLRRHPQSPIDHRSNDSKGQNLVNSEVSLNLNLIELFFFWCYSTRLKPQSRERRNKGFVRLGYQIPLKVARCTRKTRSWVGLIRMSTESWSLQALRLPKWLQKSSPSSIKRRLVAHGWYWWHMAEGF
jgi:hypothetical protein